MSYLLAGLALGLLIIFHEFGHYWVARRTGMRVERFSLGFGPTLTSWKRGETEFVLSAIPLGGYVKIAGMAVEDEVEATDTASYANKPAWQRLLVIAAGPAANYLLALVLGIGLALAVHTVPEIHWTRIGHLSPGFPAAAAGLRENDEILSVDGVAVHDWDGLREAIGAGAAKHPGKPVPMEIRRSGQTLAFAIAPTNVGGSYVIGIAPAEREVAPVPLPRAVADSFGNLWLATAENARLIGKLITHKVSASALSGPIGIISVTASAARQGFRDLAGMAWNLSIAVGFINLMPIPGLDGGRLLFLAYEVVTRRRIDQRVEGWIHAVGLLLLLLLIVFVSYGDIMHLVRHG